MIKFIIIYTAHSEEVVPKLTSIGFKNVYEKHANDDDESTGFQSASDEDTDDRGSHLSFSSVFISIISKNKTPNSEEIYKEIINITNVFSPDLIHWAGIEIFNKIRNVLPKLIGSLPEDIMPELAIQSLYKDDPDEIGMHITGLILQDVGSYISKKPPTLLNHDILITNFPKLKEIISKKNRNKENILKAVQWTLERNLKQNRKYTRDNIGIRANNLNKLSSYFESITSLGELYNNLEPGMILQYANSSEYFLCITPSCDLFRLKKGDIVTFINGKPENSLKKSFGQKYKQTSIKTSKALEIIRWDLSNIYQITAKENFIGYPEIIKLAEDPKILRFVGKLRNDIYNRILNLFYTYRTRVGIESVEIIRQIRNER
ncbi:MAG: hypothetical protein O9346_09525 [Leptospiraceae bacterium]|nr:hypothetical protein [Leptospiraceae bacterium]MCZ8346644.1 hypothetical protein [Leptospiraceae bacterium]